MYRQLASVTHRDRYETGLAGCYDTSDAANRTFGIYEKQTSLLIKLTMLASYRTANWPFLPIKPCLLGQNDILFILGA